LVKIQGDGTTEGRQVSDFQWVDCPGRLYQLAFDLHLCQRFVLCDPLIHDWTENLLVYYLTPEGDWIEQWEGKRPTPYDEEEYYDWVFQKTYTLQQPLMVTYDFLRFENGALPSELEEHRQPIIRQYGIQLGIEYDEESAIGDNPTAAPPIDLESTEESTILARPLDSAPIPRWDRGTKTLEVGADKREVFAREAENQMRIFDAFEAAGWILWIPNPFSSVELLTQTIKDFNKKSKNEHCIIRFKRKNSQISYVLQLPDRRPSL
jgi:hypothetical protein